MYTHILCYIGRSTHYLSRVDVAGAFRDATKMDDWKSWRTNIARANDEHKEHADEVMSDNQRRSWTAVLA